uniref:Uncharacterized protein n=1 Tax=Anguilla anguilla TaxID=7936 RepID=A0A0E9WIY1_ANGAN
MDFFDHKLFMRGGTDVIGRLPVSASVRSSLLWHACFFRSPMILCKHRP